MKNKSLYRKKSTTYIGIMKHHTQIKSDNRT